MAYTATFTLETPRRRVKVNDSVTGSGRNRGTTMGWWEEEALCIMG